MYEEMLKKGLISTSSTWIEKALQQKSPGLPISIASSKLLTYDRLDIKLLDIVKPN